MIAPARPHFGPPPGGARTPSLSALGLVWEPIGHTSVGSGAVVWLRVAPAANDVRLARAARALKIGETGSVPLLEVDNGEAFAVLLHGSMVVSGGLQTRTIERSVVVPPASKTLVPVRCVEAGRWSPRDRATAARFAISDRMSMKARTRLNKMKTTTFSQRGSYTTDQRAVWDTVQTELRESHVTSRTRSYDAYLDGVRKGRRDAAEQSRIRPPPEANGVVLLPRAGGHWLEAFPAPEALAAETTSLLSDLLETPEEAARSDARARDTAGDAVRLLHRLWSLPLMRVDPVKGAVGETYALDAPEGAGEIVIVASRLAHVAVGAEAGGG